MMKTEPPLLLALDERNLAQFLAALALTSLAARISGTGQEARVCWWTEVGDFAIQTEFAAEIFHRRLFIEAHSFLSALKWIPGLGGAAYGTLTSNDTIGVNPFIALGGDTEVRPPLRAFSAKVIPSTTLPAQIKTLKSPTDCVAWLDQPAKGVSSWGFDCRVNTHASDAGISSDAEKTSSRDPIFPAIELLSLAAAAFFVPTHSWQVAKNKMCVAAWTKAIPLDIVTLASSGRVHGLPARYYTFAYRGSAHGKGGAYHFFPEAIIEHSPQQNYEG
jgi:hypothetical protein